jgi:carbon storage regulator CsrA
MVVDIRGNQVRLGIEAPDSVRIVREELYERTGPGQEWEPRADRDAAHDFGVGCSA